MTRRVSENMTRTLVTVSRDSSMNQAYLLMQSNQIRHLPVINERGDVVGILSDRDVQRAMRSRVDADGADLKSEITEFDLGTRVSDYMSWPVKTFHKDSNLRSVAKEMIRDKISAFLVIEQDAVVGIITTEDLLRVLVELLAEENRPQKWSLGTILANPFQDVAM